MISLRAPNSLPRLPSQTEMPRLNGLFNSSRSVFSPSFTAQTVYAFCAAALAFKKTNAMQMAIIRFKLFSSNIDIDIGIDTAGSPLGLGPRVSSPAATTQTIPPIILTAHPLAGGTHPTCEDQGRARKKT